MKKNRIKGLKGAIIQTLSQDFTIPSLFWDSKGWNFCHIFKLNLESTSNQTSKEIDFSLWEGIWKHTKKLNKTHKYTKFMERKSESVT